MTLTARAYANPPLVEAVCEFQFDSDKPWDKGMPDQLYSRISDRFPHRRQAPVFQASVESGAESIEHHLAQIQRWQYYNDSGNTLVQLSPNLLAVNCLQPYIGWQEFLPVIQTSLSHYRDVAAPSGIHMVRLNYINRIDIADPRPELSDYFSFYPVVPEQYSESRMNFLAGMQFAMDEERDVLQIRMNSVPPQQPGATSVLLDLDYFPAQPRSVVFDALVAWLEGAHERIEAAFEHCLKDSVKTKFGEDR